MGGRASPPSTRDDDSRGRDRTCIYAVCTYVLNCVTASSMPISFCWLSAQHLTWKSHSVFSETEVRTSSTKATRHPCISPDYELARRCERARKRECVLAASCVYIVEISELLRHTIHLLRLEWFPTSNHTEANIRLIFSWW